MAGPVHPNGRIPADALRAVPADKGQTAWLLPAPAASFHRVRAACLRRHGWAPVLTSAGDGFRSYARQESVFRQRYRPQYATVLQNGQRIVDRRTWEGRYWWRFDGPAAAVPGTSNHGKGITVDVANLRYNTTAWRDLAPLLVAEGWSNLEGSRIAEPWHWNYLLDDAYTVSDTNAAPTVSITIRPGDLPDSLTPLEDPMAVRILSHTGRLYASGPGPGDWVELDTMDEARSLISRGIITEADLIPQDDGGRLVILPADTIVVQQGEHLREKVQDRQVR